MNNKVKGFVLGILAAIFYGTNPLGTLQLYADGFSSGMVLIYRYLFATLMLGAVMLLRREDFRIKWGHAIRMAVLGAFFSLSSMMLYLSFRYMPAGIASTLLFVYPIMTAVLMAALYHEHITWSTTIAIALALSGVAMLHQGDGGGLNTTGFVLVMLSSLLYAMYIISVNQLKISMSPTKFAFWVLFFGTIYMVAFTLITDAPIKMLQTPMQWVWALQIALMPTVLSLFMMNISIKLIGSTPASIMGALEPVTAVVIGVLVYHETFTLQLAIGIVLILCGVTVIVARKK